MKRLHKRIAKLAQCLEESPCAVCGQPRQRQPLPKSKRRELYHRDNLWEELGQCILPTLKLCIVCGRPQFTPETMVAWQRFDRTIWVRKHIRLDQREMVLAVYTDHVGQHYCNPSANLDDLRERPFVRWASMPTDYVFPSKLIEVLVNQSHTCWLGQACGRCGLRIPVYTDRPHEEIVIFPVCPACGGQTGYTATFHKTEPEATL